MRIMESNLQKAKRLLQAHANIMGIELPEDGYIFKMLKLAAIPDAINNLSLSDVVERISKMKDYSGREGCTYGDTDLDSQSVCYGYNLAIQNVISELND